MQYANQAIPTVMVDDLVGYRAGLEKEAWNELALKNFAMEASKPMEHSLLNEGPKLSRGSVNHPHQCVPCSFYCYTWKGCSQGIDCSFCHMEHFSLRHRGKRRNRRRTDRHAGKDSQYIGCVDTKQFDDSDVDETLDGACIASNGEFSNASIAGSGMDKEAKVDFSRLKIDGGIGDGAGHLTSASGEINQVIEFDSMSSSQTEDGTTRGSTPPRSGVSFLQALSKFPFVDTQVESDPSTPPRTPSHKRSSSSDDEPASILKCLHTLPFVECEISTGFEMAREVGYQFRPQKNTWPRMYEGIYSEYGKSTECILSTGMYSPAYPADDELLERPPGLSGPLLDPITPGTETCDFNLIGARSALEDLLLQEMQKLK
jgi:hypothetical protein